MILKNHTTIDKLMLDTAKDRAELIEYVTKNMERNLVKAMLDKIEPEKEYKIKLREREYYEDVNPYMCGYKMYIAMDEYGWIPCEERLPKDNGEYIATIQYPSYRAVEEVVFIDGSFCSTEGDSVDVVAWMEKPEVYKGK